MAAQRCKRVVLSMTWRSVFLVLAVALLLGGFFSSPGHACGPSASSNGTVNELLSQDVSTIRRSMSNTTIQTYDSGRGTRIGYYAADGRSFLWHPGYKAVLRGEWKVQPGSITINTEVKTARGTEVRQSAMSDICFRHATDGSKPVGKQRLGSWECEPLVTLLLKKRQVGCRKGDIFGLSKRRAPPFVLRRDKTTIEKLLAQCGDC